MPVIIRTAGGGGGVKYYSTDSVTILKNTGGNGKALLRWQDPNDTTLDAIVFAKWAGTIVVRKENEPPKNENDGTVIFDNKIRNQYKEQDFVDSDVQIGKMYYYGIFPYTDKGVFNNSVENVTRIMVGAYPAVFSEATWDEIVEACQNDDVPESWQVGDENTIGLSNQWEGKSIVLQIWDKHHDYLAGDGYETAPLTLGMKSVMPQQNPFNGTLLIPYSNSSSGMSGPSATWMDSNLYEDYIADIIEKAIPENVRKYIRNIKKEMTRQDSIITKECRLFLPDEIELGFGNIYGVATTDSRQYPIFTDNSSRVKGDINSWWTRTREKNSYKVTMVCVNHDGSIGVRITEYISKEAICFAFCL